MEKDDRKISVVRQDPYLLVSLAKIKTLSKPPPRSSFLSSATHSWGDLKCQPRDVVNILKLKIRSRGIGKVELCLQTVINRTKFALSPLNQDKRKFLLGGLQQVPHMGRSHACTRASIAALRRLFKWLLHVLQWWRHYRGLLDPWLNRGTMRVRLQAITLAAHKGLPNATVTFVASSHVLPAGPRKPVLAGMSLWCQEKVGIWKYWTVTA